MNWEILLKTVCSGRWILTVMVGCTFSYLAITAQIEPKDVLVIASMVFISYFNKPTEKPVEPPKQP